MKATEIRVGDTIRYDMTRTDDVRIVTTVEVREVRLATTVTGDRIIHLRGCTTDDQHPDDACDGAILDVAWPVELLHREG